MREWERGGGQGWGLGGLVPYAYNNEHSHLASVLSRTQQQNRGGAPACATCAIPSNEYPIAHILQAAASRHTQIGGRGGAKDRWAAA